jgi:hypothetical protein
MTTPDQQPSSARRAPPRWLRIIGQVAGLAAVAVALWWLAAHQLANNPAAAMALIAVAGVVLLFVSRYGWERGWKAAMAVGAAVAVAVALVQLVQAPNNSPLTSTTATTATITACQTLPRMPPVEAIVDLGRFGLSFPIVTVEVTNDGRGQLYRRFAGAIAGKLPPANHLYLVGWADPSSSDATSKRNHGSGLSLLSEGIDPDSQGCWATKRAVLGYRGAQGLAFEYTFTLVPDALQPRLIAYLDTPQYKANGLTDVDFTRFGLQRLASFRVTT